MIIIIQANKVMEVKDRTQVKYVVIDETLMEININVN